jgi:hypothetical protein
MVRPWVRSVVRERARAMVTVRFRVRAMTRTRSRISCRILFSFRAELV